LLSLITCIVLEPGRVEVEFYHTVTLLLVIMCCFLLFEPEVRPSSFASRLREPCLFFLRKRGIQDWFKVVSGFRV
jgi:hypothetical protein